MDFDSLLVYHLGELGKYQIFILLFVCSIGINSSLNNLDYIFTGATPAFRCDLNVSSDLTSNFSFVELSELMSPLTSAGKPDVCLVYNYNYSSLKVEEARRILLSNMTQTPTENCKKWTFDQDEHASTIVTDWDLVCDKAWLVATSQAVYMAGLFTTFIGGIFADKFGRRSVLLGCLLLQIVCRLFVALSPNVYVFMVGRFLLSTSTNSWYVFAFVLAMESVGPNRRPLAGQTPYFFWSIGYMIVAAIAYFIRNWRTRNFVYLIFTAPFLLHFCFLHESVRWLNAQNRNEEAFDIVKVIARVNKKELPQDVLSDLSKSEKSDAREEKSTWSSLFRSWQLIRITLLEVVIWMCVNAVYYGLIFYLPDLGGNIYLSTFVSGALELPALLYAQVTLNTKLGRRYNASFMFFITGLVLLVLIFVPAQMTWLTVTLGMVGRFAITVVFSITFISTTEIFPTKIRGLGLSLCTSASRFSSFFSPYLARLGSFATFLPPLLFGAMSIMAGILYLLLPETRGKVLEDFHLQKTTRSKKPDYSESTGTEMDNLKKNDSKTVSF